MPLLPCPLALTDQPPPADVRRFLRVAERRIAGFCRRERVTGFVSSDFACVYRALRAIEAADLLAGRWVCEWGSGFGVVACLAVMLGFEAWGVEVDRRLVAEARLLAADFDLPVEFVAGSYLPAPTEQPRQAETDFAWLDTSARSGYDEIDLTPADFDLIFAYPWPDEETFVNDLFDRHARPGAVLLTYNGGEEVRAFRKADG